MQGECGSGSRCGSHTGGAGSRSFSGVAACGFIRRCSRSAACPVSAGCQHSSCPQRDACAGWVCRYAVSLARIFNALHSERCSMIQSDKELTMMTTSPCVSSLSWGCRVVFVLGRFSSAVLCACRRKQQFRCCGYWDWSGRSGRQFTRIGVRAGHRRCWAEWAAGAGRAVRGGQCSWGICGGDWHRRCKPGWHGQRFVITGPSATWLSEITDLFPLDAVFSQTEWPVCSVPHW